MWGPSVPRDPRVRVAPKDWRARPERRGHKAPSVLVVCRALRGPWAPWGPKVRAATAAKKVIPARLAPVARWVRWGLLASAGYKAPEESKGKRGPSAHKANAAPKVKPVPRDPWARRGHGGCKERLASAGPLVWKGPGDPLARPDRWVRWGSAGSRAPKGIREIPA